MPHEGAGRITVRVARDGMSASATVVEGPPISQADVLTSLDEAGVVFGIDPAACASLAAAALNPAFQAPEWLLAGGRAAVPGIDGAYESSFLQGIQPGAFREDGSMDFHDRDLLKPARAGDVLGVLNRARPGVAGFRVDGREVPAPPAREARLRFGAGVIAEPSGALRAARSGVVLYVEGQTLDVVERYEHGADVDLHSGHLTTEGSLVVRGSVHRLFSVRASGDVEILGGIESGTVYAGGSVRIGRGVVGGDAGDVSAEGNLAAHHADGAALTAGGLLSVEDATNCELSALRIHVGKRIRGGTTTAEESVEAGEAGTPNGLETTLIAGEPLERPVLAARRALETAKNKRLAQRMDAAGVRDRGGRLKGGKAGRAIAALASDHVERRIELVERRNALRKVAAVAVGGIVHAGVVIRIGDRRLAVDVEESGVRFTLDEEGEHIRMQRPPR